MAAECLAQAQRDADLRGRPRLRTENPFRSTPPSLAHPQRQQASPKIAQLDACPSRPRRTYHLYAVEAGTPARDQHPDDFARPQPAKCPLPSRVPAPSRHHRSRSPLRPAGRRRLPGSIARPGRRSLDPPAIETAISSLLVWGLLVWGRAPRPSRRSKAPQRTAFGWDRSVFPARATPNPKYAPTRFSSCGEGTPRMQAVALLTWGQPPSAVQAERSSAGFREGHGFRGLAQAFPMHKAGALPFSRSLREGGAFRGPSVTARLVDFVFQVPQANHG